MRSTHPGCARFMAGKRQKPFRQMRGETGIGKLLRNRHKSQSNADTLRQEKSPVKPGFLKFMRLELPFYRVADASRQGPTGIDGLIERRIKCVGVRAIFGFFRGGQVSQTTANAEFAADLVLE